MPRVSAFWIWALILYTTLKRVSRCRSRNFGMRSFAETTIKTMIAVSTSHMPVPSSAKFSYLLDFSAYTRVSSHGMVMSMSIARRSDRSSAPIYMLIGSNISPVRDNNRAETGTGGAGEGGTWSMPPRRPDERSNLKDNLLVYNPDWDFICSKYSLLARTMRTTGNNIPDSYCNNGVPNTW